MARESRPGQDGHKAEPRGSRHKEVTSLQEMSVRALLKGFSDIKRWTQDRDMDRFDAVCNEVRSMELLAQMLVVQQRARKRVPDRDGIVQSFVADILSAGGQRRRRRNDIPSPTDMPALLSHVEAFPLAIHDLRNKIGGMQQWKELLEDIPMDEPDVRIVVEKKAQRDWGKIAVIADESVDFFVDPLSATRTVSLDETRTIISKAAAAQVDKTAVSLSPLQHLLPEAVGQRAVRFSTFVMRSLVANVVQNTGSQAQGGDFPPELSLQMALSDDGMRLVIIFHDNAGGFSDKFLNKRKTGYNNGAPSKGVAMKSLAALLKRAGGSIEYDNAPYPPGHTDGPIGARTTVTLPLMASS